MTSTDNHGDIPAEQLLYASHDSSIGKLILVASPRGLRRVHLLEDGQSEMNWLSKYYQGSAEEQPIHMPGFFTQTLNKFDQYLDSDKEDKEINLPFELVGGTALQRAVWLKIADIPYGRTISYTELAEQVGFPRAVRAVASACGANPLPLVIPCHRVVAKDGTLGGFSLGGIEVKEKLLALEKSQPFSKAA